MNSFAKVQKKSLTKLRKAQEKILCCKLGRSQLAFIRVAQSKKVQNYLDKVFKQVSQSCKIIITKWRTAV